MRSILTLGLVLAVSGCTGIPITEPVLPDWASWSEEAPPFPTVAETYAAVRARGTALHSRAGSVSFTIQDGQLVGVWYFAGGLGIATPTRYLRYRIYVAPHNNRKLTLLVSWACSEGRSACERFHHEIPSFLPPESPLPPDPPSPQYRSSTKSNYSFKRTAATVCGTIWLRSAAAA